MKIKIVSVGKIKKNYIAEGVCDFSRRLSKYANIELVEVKDEKHGENISPAEAEQIMKKEGNRLRAAIGERSFVVSMDVKGANLSSEQLAELISAKRLESVKELVFVIGGPLGLSGDILRKADCSVSLSKMTFPHELARLILLEQLYRACKILSGEPYHR